MTRAFALAACALACIAWTGAASADEPGRQLAAACAACHDPTAGRTAILSLAGMTADQITAAMLAYRSGTRINQIMQVVAGNLSPDEIDAVARSIAHHNAGDQP